MTEPSTSPLSRHLRMIADEVTDAHWAESINAAAEILEQPKHGPGWVERTDEEQIEVLNSRVVEVIRERDTLVRVLKATQGRIMNARIDLPGHTKGQVGRTLGGIIEFIDGALGYLKDIPNE